MALNRVKTWKVLRWDDRPVETDTIFLACKHCKTDAAIPIGQLPGGMVIAAIGLNLVFDPPGYKPPTNFMPNEIQCRTCYKIYTDEKEPADVR